MEYIFSVAHGRPLNSRCRQVSDWACAKCHRKVCLPKVVPLLQSLDQSARRQDHVLCGTFKFNSVVDIVSHRWISSLFAANGVKPNRQILSVNQLLTAVLNLKSASPRTAVKRKTRAKSSSKNVKPASTQHGLHSSLGYTLSLMTREQTRVSSYIYRQVFNIRRTKCQHLKDSSTVLRLSLPNLLKPNVESRMKI